MTEFDFDIAIIGAGCVGTSVFFELKNLGFTNMVLLDQGRRTVSATSQSGGLLRVFHESPYHRELALKNFHRLQFYQSQNLFKNTHQASGSLYFFNKSRFHAYQEGLRSMDQSEYPFEILNASLGQDRFPQLNWGKDEWAIFEPSGNYLDPLSFTEDLLENSVKEKGPFLMDSFEVKCLRTYFDRYRIGGESQTIDAKFVVIAGGARFIPQIKQLGLSVPLESRKIITYIAESQGEGPHFFDRENLQFARWGHEPYLRLSDPKTLRIKKAKPWRILSSQAAEDGYTPGRQGVLGQVSGFPGLYLATGWGGTAFKFSLEIGYRVAQAVQKNFSLPRGFYAEL